ncbi:MAG: UdgX family uracil-DNA binding protein [Pseudomonadota bacterium]
MTRTVVAKSFAQWREASRKLLAQQVPPHAIHWIETDDGEDLFGDRPAPSASDATPTTHVLVTHSSATDPSIDSEAGVVQPRIPRELLAMLESAACFRVSDRYAFLYQVVWRWQLGERDVLSAADQDGVRLHSMLKMIHREEHKMHAYLRFRERPDTLGAPKFVAWFEPEHDVLPQVAQHFAHRMGKITWMIGTPDATASWNGQEVHIGPAVMRGPEDIDDIGETMWLTYYRSTFNPARLNVSVMNGHIASRYWKNMPEAKLVPSMIAEAAAGAQRDGQTKTVGARNGAIIPISAELAQPERDQPSTLDQCRRCDLWRDATQAVPGIGLESSRIMLVGEQPGDQEDLAGKPFIGPAGQVLDDALRKAGLARDTVYVTNAVKHFKWEPRGKRRLHKTPAQMEINACRYWLDEELARVKPEVVVALGGTALKSILRNPKATLTDKIGTPFQHEGRWIVVVYHPSYILRVPNEEARVQAMGVLIDGLAKAQTLQSLN